MQPKISVIIPVYNVENYLHRCIDSILNQTFQNFEIILIDDGSIDHSGEICDDYAAKDYRIKVIHKKNARVSAARNDGLRLARGKYISFIDSDDWIDPEMYQKMIEKAEDLNLDFIMSDYKKRSNDYQDKRTQPIRGGYYSDVDIKNELYQCLIMFEDIEFPPTISNWVCLLNRNFLNKNNIHYDEDIHYCEDSIVGSKILYHATNFYYLKNHHYYNYFYNPTSTTNTYNKNKWDSYLRINEKLKEYFGETMDFDFSRQIKINMLYFTLHVLGQLKHSEKNGEEKVEMIKKIMYHPQVKGIFSGFKLPKVSWKMKVAILLIRYKMARLYSFLVLNHRRHDLSYFLNEKLNFKQ